MAVHGVDPTSAAQLAPPVEGMPADSLPTALPEVAKAAAGHEQRPLSATIGQLFGAAEQHRNALEISYRSGGLNEIVTVFTDPASGKEIAQLPSHILIDMAAFFDQHSGVTLDRNV